MILGSLIKHGARRQPEVSQRLCDIGVLLNMERGNSPEVRAIAVISGVSTRSMFKATAQRSHNRSISGVSPRSWSEATAQRSERSL